MKTTAVGASRPGGKGSAPTMSQESISLMQVMLSLAGKAGILQPVQEECCKY
jgi:hypothetical protein